MLNFPDGNNPSGIPASFAADNSDYKAIKLASAVIPDIGDHILKQLASDIKSSEQLEDKDNYAQKKRRACLDNLVHVYGAELIINKCRTYGLEKQAAYLENKFKRYPQILDQVRVLCKWSKLTLDLDYRKSDKKTPLEWYKIHKINEKTLEVLSDLAVGDKYPNYLIIDCVTGILEQICERAEISLQKFSEALPTSSNKVDIKLCTTGALFINGRYYTYFLLDDYTLYLYI